MISSYNDKSNMLDQLDPRIGFLEVESKQYVEDGSNIIELL